MATTITPRIVTVNTTVTLAPEPSQLQQSGAIISLGGTTLATNAYQYCGSLAQLTAILSTAGNFAELTAMGTTFFAQGNSVGLYVLELGVQSTVPDGITALETWITANSSPQVFYAYLTPEAWDASGAALNTMAANYSSPSGKTYFFVTTTSTTITAYAGTKSIYAFAPSPTATSTQFGAAADFYSMLANQPSAASPAYGLTYRFVYGDTPWVRNSVNNALIDTILSAYGNVHLTGAEGGISTTSIYRGTTMDGNQFKFWYAVDWFQIQAKLQMANAILNGANSNPPLYYNQQGINTLLSVAQAVLNSSVSFGLNLTGTLTATPFYTYVQANPADYAAGNYNGFAATITPQLGFETITFNLDATQFVAGG